MDKRNRGFTTFKAICVAATVIAQAAVLQPVIKNTNRVGKTSACLSNLSRCASAVQMYMSDYEGTLPSSVLASTSPGTPPTQAQVTSFLTAKGSPYPFRGTGRAVTWAQVLSRYVKRPSVVFCPSDTPRTRTSYWWKYSVDLAWRNLGCKYEGQYPYPSSQVILYEHAGWHVGDAAGIKDGVKINVVNMDGRAAIITVRNGPTSYPPAFDERTGAAGTRLGEPMYYNYDNTTQTRHSGVADYVDPRIYSDSY
jgi:hypothetical protein